MKKLAFLAMLLVPVFSTFATESTATGFTDLKTTDRFYEEMMFLENEEMINGYPDSTFRPHEPVTRAAAAIMIGKALDLDSTQRATPFSDVGAGQAASGYIDSAVDASIISGYKDGTYRPYQAVTRGQMAILLARAFDLTTEANASFFDVSVNMTAYQYIQRIYAAKITAGYPDGTYHPNSNITRAQFSAFLARALDDRFKIGLPSYAMDQSKVYTYSADEVGTIKYVYDKTEANGWNVWTTYEGGLQAKNPMVEREDDDGYYFSYLTSEGPDLIVQLLKYPAVVGQKWSIDPGGTGTMTITSTTETVTTPAGTFHNVVEVTGGGNVKVYYAPNIGRIKSSINGAVMLQLEKVE